MKLENSLKSNIYNITNAFFDNQDIIVKRCECVSKKVAILYIKGMVNVQQLADYVIKPIQVVKNIPSKDANDYILNNVISFPEIKAEVEFDEVITQLTKGKVVLLFDGDNVAHIVELDSPKERSLTEPPTSAVLKGPREGFNENIKTNISVIRKIFATNQLQMKMLTIGKVTSTDVCVMYLKNVADKTIVQKIINKLKTINIDGVLDSYYVAEFLKPHKVSMFKQIGNTEKPDIACAKMLEGRIVVLVDGSPMALTLPFVLMEDFQSADDYYKDSSHASFVRSLRVVSCFITILLPGLYIAMQMFHYKAVPLSFLVTIINSTQGLPLTPVTEILFVLVLFEILYEASLRMPEYLGIALSVVGALILGDTAVKAGIISPPSVMIVALSGITLYTIPDQANQLSLLRVMFTIIGAALGFYGIILLSVFLIMYLCDYDNYKSPYLAPFAPIVKGDLKDSILKVPLGGMKYRPKSISIYNRRRMGVDKKD